MAGRSTLVGCTFSRLIAIYGRNTCLHHLRYRGQVLSTLAREACQIRGLSTTTALWKNAKQGSDSSSSDSSDSDGEVDPKIAKAAKAVADILPGDAEMTQSDILRHLKSERQLTQRRKIIASGLGQAKEAQVNKGETEPLEKEPRKPKSHSPGQSPEEMVKKQRTAGEQEATQQKDEKLTHPPTSEQGLEPKTPNQPKQHPSRKQVDPSLKDVPQEGTRPTPVPRQQSDKRRRPVARQQGHETHQPISEQREGTQQPVARQQRDNRPRTVDKSQPEAQKQKLPRKQPLSQLNSINDNQRASQRDAGQNMFQQRSPQRQRAFEERDARPLPKPQQYSSLYESPGLGLFSKSMEEVGEASEDAPKTLWDKMRTEREIAAGFGKVHNGFQDQIRLTKEGKLWTFPINNDADWPEEEKVGFHEHVFLEDQLEDFPRAGPIRHFMELVTTALSQNPYLSVQQKHEHIDWFRHYFRQKQSVYQDVLRPEDLMKSSSPETQ